MSKKKILVTGASGYIGSHTVNYFQKKRYEVHTLDRNKPTIKSSKHYLIDLENTQKKTFNTTYECIIHLASYTLPRESFSNIDKYILGNLKMTNNLINTFPNFKKFIFTSTANLYKPSKNIKENSEIEAQSPYGESKLINEKYLFHMSKNHKSQFSIFRLFNASGGDVEGSFRYEVKPKNKLLIPSILRSQKKNKIFYLNGNKFKTKDGTCIRDFIHVYDIAQAFENFLKYGIKNKYEIFNLGSSKGYSIYDVIKKFEKFFGKKINLKIITSKKGDPSEIICNNKKLKNLLKWKDKYSDLDTIIKSSLNSFII